MKKDKQMTHTDTNEVCYQSSGKNAKKNHEILSLATRMANIEKLVKCPWL